jgi:hypothetical protein
LLFALFEGFVCIFSQAIDMKAEETKERTEKADHKQEVAETDDKFVEKLADSIVLAFFIALVIKIGQYIYSNYFSIGSDAEL